MSNMVPHGWKITALNKKIDILSGFPFKSEQFTDDRSKIGLIRIRDLIKQTVETFYNDEYPDEFVVKKGDVLIGMDGDFTIVRWKSCEALLNQRICKVNASAESGFDTSFLFYSLMPELESIHNATGATTVKHLSVKDIRLIEKPFPPLPEQQKIAAILTSVDEVIESTQAQINKLKDLKTGMMQELLTKGIGRDGLPHTEFKDSPVGRIPKEWERQQLVEVTSLITKGATPTTAGHAYSSSGIRFYRSVNATLDGTLDRSDVKYITEAADSTQKRSRLSVGDVILSIVGAQTGRTYFCVTDEKELPANINQNIALIRPIHNKLNPRFLKYAIASSDFQYQVDLEITTQAQPSLSLAQVGNFLINIPPLQEQDEIALRLDSVAKTIKSKENKLVLLENTKKALMQDLLTGKVRVKVN